MHIQQEQKEQMYIYKNEATFRSESGIESGSQLKPRNDGNVLLHRLTATQTDKRNDYEGSAKGLTKKGKLPAALGIINFTNGKGAEAQNSHWKEGGTIRPQPGSSQCESSGWSIRDGSGWMQHHHRPNTIEKNNRGTGREIKIRENKFCDPIEK